MNKKELLNIVENNITITQEQEKEILNDFDYIKYDYENWLASEYKGSLDTYLSWEKELVIELIEG